MVPIKYTVGSIIGLLMDINSDIKGINIDKLSKNL
jgi:hypothetical protein